MTPSFGAPSSTTATSSPLPAPVAISAVLSDYADVIEVRFDMAVTGDDNCTTLLDEQTRLVLTDDESTLSCTWSSAATLLVAFVSSLETPSGTRVGFNSRVVHRADSPSVSAMEQGVFLVGRSQPPDAVAAIMSSTGNSVKVVFDGPSSGKVSGVSPSGPCSALLTNTNLGLGALCVWSSLSMLEIRLGYAADTSSLLVPFAELNATSSHASGSNTSVVESSNTVVSCRSMSDGVRASTLFLRPGAVTAVPGGMSKQGAQCILVLPPDEPIAPVISLSGAVRISACDALSLDASGTIDFSGRDLKFVWSMAPPPGNETNEEASSSQQGQYFTVPAGSLLPGGVYNVTVTAANFLGGVATVSVDVAVASTIMPRVWIDGSTARTVVPNIPQVSLTDRFPATGSG